MSTPLDELARLTTAARNAAAPLARTGSAERAGWLRAMASDLDDARDRLVATAVEETHLDAERLRGEVARTTGQLRLFASAIEDGAYREAVIDHAEPSATPPRPDLRRILVPLGPVAMFAGSNFPFAFSVAGGDTAAALAVGCPVIVKAHSGHPRLSELTASIVADALARLGAPAGTFAMVEGREVGTALITDPAIKAGSFTGSVAGGRALFDLASARPDPIPFYGELGSINPTVITRAAVAARGTALAEGLAASFTLGVGQFCTKPGVVLAPRDSGFAELLRTATAGRGGGRLLTERIADAYPQGLRELASDPDVTALSGSIEQPGAGADAEPVVLRTTATAVAARPDELLVECFGPTTLLVEYDDHAELLAALDAVEGSLTATVHAEAADEIDDIVESLSARAGRVLFEGWPTGVAVTWSQNHGGPWPATTSIFTSVGVTSMRRFQRPIVFQSAPERVLPPELREDNPLGVPRRVDGVLEL
ncbi:aldehyde dehydrogenase (NADP(+)) [Pseudolysinimonas sp.]|uniref:aldehyde dehydrogenase (NADP(+)) n=1 Tax=Pseudolysinimonas sp. TaxID=2680009 RepID=UPI003F7F7A71